MSVTWSNLKLPGALRVLTAGLVAAFMVWGGVLATAEAAAGPALSVTAPVNMGQGIPNNDCPPGTVFLVKIEANQPDQVGNSYTEGPVTITVSEVKLANDTTSTTPGASGEPIAYTWTSTVPIEAIAVKSSNTVGIVNANGATSGEFETSSQNQQGIPQGISHVDFCVSTATTQPPTTEAPTTEAPTTEAPTTEAPTTEAPTTEAPTTEAPTTEAPTTEAPTTEAPTTEAPTTEAPTTEAPTTEAPTTEQPTTKAPTTKAPTTKAPTTQGPAELPNTGVGADSSGSSTWLWALIASLGFFVIAGAALITRGQLRAAERK